MLRVVLDKPEPNVIGVSDLHDGMIIAVRYEGTLGILKRLPNSSKYAWAALDRTGYLDVATWEFESLAKAVCRMLDLTQVFVLSSLSELWKWIRDNCGESGEKKGGKTEGFSTSTLECCEECDHADDSGLEEPCKSCRVSRPTNFKAR